MPSPIDNRPSPSGPIAAVITSVFGRYGPDIVAMVGDYLASQVSNDSTVDGETVKDALNNIVAGLVASIIANDSDFQGATVKDVLDTLKEYSVVTGEPNIFEYWNSEMSVDSESFEFTVEPTAAAGEFNVWIKGVKHTYDAAQTVEWTDVSGLWYFLFDEDGVLYATQDGSVVKPAIRNGEGAFIATYYWNSDEGEGFLLTDERHSRMEGTVHYHFHKYFGARWGSGGSLTDITADATASDAATQFGTTSAEYADEDREFDSLALAKPAQIYGFYQVWNALEGKNLFYETPASAFPFLIDESTSLPKYNLIDSGTGQASVEDIPSGSFFNTHTFLANAYDGTRRLIFFPAQAYYGSRNAARAGALTEIQDIVLGALDVLDAELIAAHTVCREYRSTYGGTTKTRIVSLEDDNGNLVDYLDWLTNDKAAGAGTTLSGNPIGVVSTGSNLSTRLAPDYSVDSSTITDGTSTSYVYPLGDLEGEGYYDLTVAFTGVMATSGTYRKATVAVDATIKDLAGTLTLVLEGSQSDLPGGDNSGVTVTVGPGLGGDIRNVLVEVANATGEDLEGYVDVGYSKRKLPA